MDTLSVTPTLTKIWGAHTSRLGYDWRWQKWNIISDGFYVKGRPHPRLYGTFPLLLGEMSRERGWLTLATAVHKITEKPAHRFSIPKRGRLERGYFADVVVLDPETVNSSASYENPALQPRGICHVFRNGVKVLSEGPCA